MPDCKARRMSDRTWILIWVTASVEGYDIHRWAQARVEQRRANSRTAGLHDTRWFCFGGLPASAAATLRVYSLRTPELQTVAPFAVYQSNTLSPWGVSITEAAWLYLSGSSAADLQTSRKPNDPTS